MPTASKSGITGHSVIPLVNADETLCSVLSLLPALPTKGFHTGDSQGGEKETVTAESKTVPSPVPSPAAARTPAALVVHQHRSIKRWEWKILHPRLWAVVGETPCVIRTFGG